MLRLPWIFFVSMILCLSACSLSPGDDADKDPTPLKLVISGPATAAPGVPESGYTVTATRSGLPVSDLFISLTSSKGTIDAPPDRPATEGANSDLNGQLAFVLHAPADLLQGTTITITAKAKDLNVTKEDADGLAQPTEVTATYLVGVQPDTFQFLQPAFGASAKTGSLNAIPLKFQWTHAVGDAAQGVTGNISLSLTGTGYFVVQGVTLPSGQAVTVHTNPAAGGNFGLQVSVANDKSGAVTVTAVDTAAAGRTAQVSMQFVEEPGSILLNTDVLSVQAAPSASRFAALTATAYNKQNLPMSGASVTFSLTKTSSANVNERVAPAVGTTSTDGTVTSSYEAGPSAGTAIVKACITGTSLCDSRDITVEEDTDSTTTGSSS